MAQAMLRTMRRAIYSGSVGAVYRWSERSRAQSLLLPPVHPPDDDQSAAALEELRQLRLAVREAELTGEPTPPLLARCASLERLIRHRSWSITGPAGSAEPASLDRVKAALGSSAMVVYVDDGANLSALTVVPDAAYLTMLGPVRAAEETVLRLRADVNAAAGRVLPLRLAAAIRAATFEDAAALAALAFDPLRTLVRERDLVVVPTGGLLTTPWGMLPGCTGRSVTVAPSATSWLAARRRLEAVPADHPVLSCCELGLSDVRPGDETIGFSTALLAAGTATVIASVGLVADDAAMRTMVAFHRLLAGGNRPAAALADAMASNDTAGFICLGAG
jgi:hypothetical protein